MERDEARLLTSENENQISDEIMTILHRARYEYLLTVCQVIGILEDIKISLVLERLDDMEDEEDD